MTNMIPRVEEAKFVEDYKVWLRFSDGKAGVIDFSGELWGPVFEPLKDRDTFRKVHVHPERDTLTWPNGADFAPEFLYDQLAAQHVVGGGR